MSAGTIDAIERLLSEAEDADDALRDALSILVGETEIAWAGIAFVEEGAITLGPTAGSPDEGGRVRVPVVFQGALVGELWVDGDPDQAFLERVAGSLAPHVLIGWDTRGEAWEP